MKLTDRSIVALIATGLFVLTLFMWAPTFSGSVKLPQPSQEETFRELGRRLDEMTRDLQNAYVITFDVGGSVMAFIEKYEQIEQLEGKVVIDGMCISACTLVLAVVTDSRVCVTPRARLAFHSASVAGEYSEEGTRLVWHLYPEKVRSILRAKGWNGDTAHPELIYVEGAELETLYKPCAAGGPAA